MAAPDLIIEPLTPAIGAEIAGVDLSAPLDEATLDGIYRALIDHLVIFFRDQPIPPEAHLALARTFGEPEPPHPVYPHVEDFENIVLLASGPDSKPDTNGWHTDMTYRGNPPFASVLCAREVPAVGGDTLWASMYAAYAALPADIKAHIADLEALHEIGDFRDGYLAAGGAPSLSAAMAKVGCAVHRVVQHHPVTGRPYLYVNHGFTQYIVGMKRPESDRLLHYLFDHVDRPEFQVRFRWRKDSVAMWDNRVTQHYATADYLPNYRCMHRVTVVNDRRAAGTGEARSLAAG